jgi:putative ABC transport system substrate-binding protein
MKKLYILFLIFILFNSCSENNNLPVIGIVQLSEDPVLDIAREAAIQSLKTAGFEDGKNIRIDYKNAQGELSNVIMILKAFQNQKVKLIITNTTPCMSAAAANIKDIPVVFTVSFGPEQIGITAPPNLSGVYDPLKMDEFVGLINSTIPDLKVIGLPYNPSEPNADFAAKEFVKESSKLNIRVILKPVNSPNDILQAIQSLSSDGVQAYVVAADNTVYLGLESIANYASEKKIPLFVSDPFQAKKGAAIGYGVNYEVWGRTSGEIAAKILKDGDNYVSEISTLDYYQLVINQSAAKSQGLYIPENIIERADLKIE